MFEKAIELLNENKVITHKGVQYAMISGQIHFVVLTEDSLHYRHRELLEISTNDFLERFRDFSPHKGEVVECPKDYSPFVVEDYKLYDFTIMPQGHCPKCGEKVTRKNVIIEGRYSHCPKCQYRFFRAPRIDRSRDGAGFAVVELPMQLMKKPREPRLLREKKEKPIPPTNEELMEQAIAAGNTVKRKISF
jgi:DNA-directed RNA polymerase subunit RPC12/RpoP